MGFRRIILPYDGHLLRPQSETLPAWEAFQKSVNGNEYLYATKSADGELITLTKHVLRCAECAKEFLSQDGICDAQNNADVDTKEAGEAEMSVNKHSDMPSFMDWSVQQTLPECSFSGTDFLFTGASKDVAVLTCPHCGRRAVTGNHTIEYEAFSNERCLTISHKIEYCRRGERLPYGKFPQERLYPLTMALEFNFEAHKTELSFYDCESSQIECIDINERACPLDGYLLKTHIDTLPPLKSIVKTELGRFYEDELPFSDSEITLELAVSLNRFQGFPPSFYSAIPIDLTTRKLSSNFLHIAEKLEQYQNVPTLTEDLPLVKTKAIRRVLFENPSLLFYSEEIKTLPFSDTNVILQILRSNNVYRFFATLRTYPGVLCYVKDLIKTKGEPVAWQTINKNVVSLMETAAVYLVLTPSKKSEALKGDLKDLSKRIYREHSPSYNQPVSGKYQVKIPPCAIGKYEFAPLKNSLEYVKAAENLSNCLADCIGDRVIGVKRGGRYVAAIEVRGNAVTQAKLKDNKPVDGDAEISDAFYMWLAQNKLKYSVCNDECPELDF